jgi:HSP20 family protein
MRGLQNELNRIFGFTGNGEVDLWIPQMDVVENGKAITLKIEVPGIERKDIKVEAEGGILTVSGERKIEKEEKKDDYVRTERSYGRFERCYSIPDYVDAKKISAECKNGVLCVVLPKVEGAGPSPQKIEVK